MKELHGSLGSLLPNKTMWSVLSDGFLLYQPNTIATNRFHDEKLALKLLIGILQL